MEIYYVKQALWLTLLTAGPLVLYMMAVGLILGFVQAIFQLQDQSLPFAFKLGGSILILIALAPWISQKFIDFINIIFSTMSG